MTPIRILELRTVRGTGGGPEKTILLGSARTDPRRFGVVVCYLRDSSDTLFGIDERAAALNLDYVSIVEHGRFDRAVLGQLRRLVRERKIDIVHAHDYKTDLLALFLARLESVIPLTTAHGWTGHSPIERRLYYPADKLLMRAFPKVIAVSSEIRGTLLRWGCRPERVQVVLNGIDHETFRRQPGRGLAARQAFNLPADAIVLGSVGRLEPQKRFDTLIDAFAGIRARHPEARLVIAGEGSARRDLEARIRSLRLEDSCHLIGHFGDIVTFHHALDMFVQSSEYEGTPNVVLEAMALETAIVATSAGGTAELARDGREALIVSPGSTSSLLDAINRALDDPVATTARRVAARRRTETDLSFATRMATVEAIYERLMLAGLRARRLRQSAATTTSAC
jgi:glycosyltransferase involved in cell wall biosynthesis